MNGGSGGGGSGSNCIYFVPSPAFINKQPFIQNNLEINSDM